MERDCVGSTPGLALRSAIQVTAGRSAKGRPGTAPTEMLGGPRGLGVKMTSGSFLTFSMKNFLNESSSLERLNADMVVMVVMVALGKDEVRDERGQAGCR